MYKCAGLIIFMMHIMMFVIYLSQQNEGDPTLSACKCSTSVPFSVHRTSPDPKTNLSCTSIYRGSGSFVVDGEQFFLLTCCHNFLTKEEGNPNSLQKMTAVDLKEELTANCQTAMYEVSDRTTFKTNEIAASDVLALDAQGCPHLYIVKVYTYSGTMCFCTLQLLCFSVLWQLQMLANWPTAMD